MNGNKYFVTHSAGCIPCDSISREKEDGTYEEITYQEIANKLNENTELKQVLGGILLEVKQDITCTNQTGEIKVFINPNSFDLISEVLRKYGALKEWYK